MGTEPSLAPVKLCRTVNETHCIRCSIDTAPPQRIGSRTSPLCSSPRAKSAPSQSSVFKREAMKSHLLSALMCLSGSFLYLLRFSPTIEYFTVYSLTTAGKPKTVTNDNAPRDVAG